MDSLRCRTYTRLRLREQSNHVNDIEKEVVEARQKLSAIDRENKK